jgi:predicted phosphatase
MAKRKDRDPIPETFASMEEAADFWDNHDLGDYWDLTKEVSFNVQIDKTSRYVRLDKGVAKKVSDIAKTQGISIEALVNAWIKEKLAAT